MEGSSTDNEDREAMKALEATEVQIYKDIEVIDFKEQHKRQGMEPYGYVPKLIDVTETHSVSNNERHILYKSLGITTEHKQIFCITGITNNTAISTLGREIAITGHFLEKPPNVDWRKTQFFIVFGNRSHRVVCFGEWVFSCAALFHLPGTVNFYLSLDGTTPISQILKFDYLLTPTNQELFSRVAGFRQQLCLAHLLYSKTGNAVEMSLNPPTATDQILLSLILSLCKCTNTNTFIRTIEYHGFPLVLGESLFLRDLLEQKLGEWISERLEEGCTTGTRNYQGFGVIHLLAILGYRSHIQLYCDLGKGKLSLDFQDIKGWTALHWAAFFNRNLTAQLLLDMGANPTLVTRKTPEFPNGLTVAEVASNNGHQKLADHLAKVTEEYLRLRNVAATQDASSSQKKRLRNDHVCLRVAEYEFRHTRSAKTVPKRGRKS